MSRPRLDSARLSSRYFQTYDPKSREKVVALLVVPSDQLEPWLQIESPMQPNDRSIDRNRTSLFAKAAPSYLPLASFVMGTEEE